MATNLRSSQLLPMDTARWGPPAWEFLYCIAFTYPYKPTKEQQDDMLNFLQSLKGVLPCPTCRKNFRKKIKHISVEKDLRSKKALVHFIMGIKNSVAKSNNKRLDTYEELCKKFHIDKLEE